MAARAMLGWSQKLLAEKAGIGFSTIRDFEKRRHTPYQKTTERIRTVLEEAGVEFIPADEAGGPGVRLKRQ